MTVRRLVLLTAIVGTIGCDRVTKHAAETLLADVPPRTFLADTVWVGYAENEGGFLSAGASWPPVLRTSVFTGLTGITLAALAVAGIRSGLTGLPAMGLALFVAGGASNWLDRVIRGSVVDFLQVAIGPVRTGVFNVADVALMAGAGLLLWAEIRQRHTGSPPSHAGTT